jgi:hypothetical protein
MGSEELAPARINSAASYSTSSSRGFGR